MDKPPISVPTESRQPDESMQDIRGEVGFIAGKFGLSADATEAIYAMFCGQAARWEAKVRACEDRIRNQREEIKKRAASSSLLPVPRQIQVQCEMCDGTGRMHVTHDMAIDAGNLNLSGQLISCGTCGGDGFQIEQAEPNEYEKLASLPVGESRDEK